MDFDFSYHDTQYLTHGLHPYPARMIPQIAKTLITQYSKPGTLIFDPFCGTGTTLVEAKLHQLDSIGFDLNPLARLIAKVKTTNIEEQTLKLYLKNFHDHLFNIIYKQNTQEITVPKYPNTDYWLSKNVQRNLVLIKTYINSQIDNRAVKDFFLVAFSLTIRECSWTRNEEFKLYKMPPEKIKYFRPDVFSTMEKILSKNYLGLLEFNTVSGNSYCPRIFPIDSSKYIPRRIIKDGNVGLIITSPPYGDSATTVSYGQFSALSNEWIFGIPFPRKLDRDLLGGIRAKRMRRFKSEVLNSQIDEISKIDRKRALDVVRFYRDYYYSIRNISSVVKSNGIVCFIVSNRTVRGVNLNTDIATIDFFKMFGFQHISTIERNILNKRLPKRNSTNGKEGFSGNLMNNEYIVIMQR